MQKRGKPDHNSLIHLRVDKSWKWKLLGMKEHEDYTMNVKCHNGNYHILYTDDPKQVTCPLCKAKHKM